MSDTPISSLSFKPLDISFADALKPGSEYVRRLAALGGRNTGKTMLGLPYYLRAHLRRRRQATADRNRRAHGQRPPALLAGALHVPFVAPESSLGDAWL